MSRSAPAWYIHHGYVIEREISRTRLFRSNRSQAVRLSKEVAFPPDVTEVSVHREGSRRVILPADAAWDDFVAGPGIDLGERSQPQAQEREPL